MKIGKIEEAILIAAAETGVPGGKSIPLCFTPKKRARIWMEEEENFVRENHGWIPNIQIARYLGRTLISVELHIKREMHLVSMSKNPGILTAEHVANGLGLDSKSVHLLMDTGRMPCRRLPSARMLRVVDRFVFIKWMLNSENWLYFKPVRVGAFFRKGKRGVGESYDFAFWESARLIMLKVHRKWKDRWLTPGQVKRLLRIGAAGTRYINVAIHRGTLKAKRWGNWWIRKSDLPRGKTINFRGEIKGIHKCPG